MKKYSTIIFDFDGTVLNTLGDIAHCANVAFEKHGFPKRTEAEIKSFMGSGAEILIKRALPENSDDTTILKVLATYKKHYFENSNTYAKAYENIPEVLKTLKENNFTLGIASNKPEEVLKNNCEAYFSGVFDYVIGDSENIIRKPSPDMLLKAISDLSADISAVLYVGDSKVDALTAVNAKVDFVGVDWGYDTREELIQAGAKTIISNPNELLSIVL